jgi:hypothetical protein
MLDVAALKRIVPLLERVFERAEIMEAQIEA